MNKPDDLTTVGALLSGQLICPECGRIDAATGCRFMCPACWDTGGWQPICKWMMRYDPELYPIYQTITQQRLMHNYHIIKQYREKYHGRTQ